MLTFPTRTCLLSLAFGPTKSDARNKASEGKSERTKCNFLSPTFSSRYIIHYSLARVLGLVHQLDRCLRQSKQK